MRRTMSTLHFLLLMTTTACSSATESPAIVPEVVGHLEDRKIREASGLARSQRRPGQLWVINDNGAKAVIHAIDQTGANSGKVNLKGAKNKDWEDLASFQIDGIPYLMVADIGDNDARRKYRTLYIADEPSELRTDDASIAWQVDFAYPDGARDAEAAAVDTDNQRILVLSKRDLPPKLYSVPLRPVTQGRQTATLLGSIESLQKPTRQELASARKNKSWYWQPVGFDISSDQRAAVILTYNAVYYYERHAQQNWLQALNSNPARVSLGNFENAEAIAFGDENRTVFVTGENKNSLLLRIAFPIRSEKTTNTIRANSAL